MAKYIFHPFAETGDKAPIPETAIDGSVNWLKGFSIDYELPPGGASKPVPRPQTNQYLFDISSGLQQYQQLGFNDFITTADNDGTPFAYDINAYCRYNDNVYQSAETANDTLPTDASKWKLLTGGLVPVAASATVTPAELGQEIEVTVTAGNVTLTMPAASTIALGTETTFRIVAADAGQNNRLRIVGDGSELISSFNIHDFYFVGSWVKVKKVTSGLIISDYYDSRSIIFQSYFAPGNSYTIVGPDQIIIYPSIDPIILNRGNFYSTSTGKCTLKIRGQYSFHSSIHSALGNGSVIADILFRLNGSTLTNSTDRRQWSNEVPMGNAHGSCSTSVMTDELTTISREGFGLVNSDSNVISGFAVTLEKRIF